MKNNYNVKANKKINIKNEISQSEHNILLNIAKDTFKNKQNIGWSDTVIYNLLRGKPLFNGIEKLKENKYYAFKEANVKYSFIHSFRYKLLIDIFGSNFNTNQSSIFTSLKEDKENKIVSMATKVHLATIMVIGINEAFNLKNGDIV